MADAATEAFRIRHDELEAMAALCTTAEDVEYVKQERRQLNIEMRQHAMKMFSRLPAAQQKIAAVQIEAIVEKHCR